MTKQSSVFESSEFNLCVFLYSQEVPLLGIKPTSDPKKKVFIFQQTANLPTLVTNFWLGKEKVDPLQLLTAERELKRLLYSNSYTSFQINEKGGEK